jgi:hypothetical protein
VAGLQTRAFSAAWKVKTARVVLGAAPFGFKGAVLSCLLNFRESRKQEVIGTLFVADWNSPIRSPYVFLIVGVFFFSLA